ncbi:C-C motif chemokine 27a [Anabas testudineus]|uniref:Chemokine interleukin-8-like domain-containing protein n=1 Tax=Anabas testudineus TaxID=64144 RepID=A0A3Q1J4M8_ANATE|nr:C-C motif chemokine 27a [Anabas testudineus]
MDVKVVFVIVCLCALAITSTEARIRKCCITTNPSIPKGLVRKIYKIDRQDSRGACDISALLVYVKNRKTPLCIHPKVLEHLKHTYLKNWRKA